MAEPISYTVTAEYIQHRVVNGTYQARLYWRVQDGIVYVKEPDGWLPTKIPVEFLKEALPKEAKQTPFIGKH